MHNFQRIFFGGLNLWEYIIVSVLLIIHIFLVFFRKIPKVVFSSSTVKTQLIVQVFLAIALICEMSIVFCDEL